MVTAMNYFNARVGNVTVYSNIGYSYEYTCSRWR